MSDFPRLAVRHPQPFDIVGDSFVLCGLGSAFEGVVGSAALTDRNGTVLAEISPMFVSGSGSGFTLFDFPVTYGVPATAEGTLRVDADNPSGLPEKRMSRVPLNFGGGPVSIRLRSPRHCARRVRQVRRFRAGELLGVWVGGGDR